MIGFRNFKLWNFYILVRNILRFRALGSPFQDGRRPQIPILNCRTFVKFRQFRWPWKQMSHCNSWPFFSIQRRLKIGNITLCCLTKNTEQKISRCGIQWDEQIFEWSMIARERIWKTQIVSFGKQLGWKPTSDVKKRYVEAYVWKPSLKDWNWRCTAISKRVTLVTKLNYVDLPLFTKWLTQWVRW